MGAKQIEIIFQNRVQAVTFADESQVVGGYYSGHIRGWKIEDGQQLGITMQANNRINFVAVSRDGHWIVSGDHGKTATVWDAATRDKVLEYSVPYWPSTSPATVLKLPPWMASPPGYSASLLVSDYFLLPHMIMPLVSSSPQMVVYLLPPRIITVSASTTPMMAISCLTQVLRIQPVHGQSLRWPGCLMAGSCLSRA